MISMRGFSQRSGVAYKACALVAVLSVLLFGVFPGDTASAAEITSPVDASANGTQSTVTTALVLQESSDYLTFMKKLGFTSASDFPELSYTESQRDAAESLLEYAVKRFQSSQQSNESSTVSTSTSTCSQSERYAHASEVAAQNSRTDSSAKDSGHEIIYMYLSHYVDLPAGKADGACDVNDNSEYLANWITNDDRNAYDSYLNAVGLTNAASLAVDSVGAAASLSDAASAGSVGKGLSTFILDEIPSFLVNSSTNHTFSSGTEQTVLELADTVIFQIKHRSDGSLSEEEAQKILDDLTEQADSSHQLQELSDSLQEDVIAAGISLAVTDVAISASASLGAGLFSIALPLIELQAMEVSTEVQMAAFSGMLSTLSGRLSSRLMRSWGM